MNYGKYKFEQSKKEKEARKKQKTFELKEIRITPNIDTHDFEFKVKNAQKFLEDGNKVKITVRFRGREMNYLKQGESVLNNFITALQDIEESLSFDSELNKFWQTIRSDIDMLQTLKNNLDNWDRAYEISKNINFVTWPRKKIESSIKEEAKIIRDDVKKKLNKGEE